MDKEEKKRRREGLDLSVICNGWAEKGVCYCWNLWPPAAV